MVSNQLEHHFLRRGIKDPRPKRRPGADQHGIGAAKIRHALRLAQPAAAHEHRGGLALRPRHGVGADNRLIGDSAPAIVISGAGLQRRGGRQAARAADPDPVRTALFEPHMREIAGHIGNEIGLRVADFIQHLFGHGADADQAAGAFGLGDDQRAIAGAFGNRAADTVPAGHIAPIGEGAAGRLRPAFDQVPGQRAGSQKIEIARPPAEFMDQRPQRQRRIDNAPGDDDIGAAGQRRRDGKRPEIGVAAGQPVRRKRRAIGHVDRAGGKFGGARRQVVAGDGRDLQVQPQFRQPPPQHRRQPGRVDATGIGDDPHPLFGNRRQMRADMDRHEIGREAARRIGQPHPAEQSHRAFGQIIEDDVIDPGSQQLRHRQRRIDEEGRAAADADNPVVHRLN